VTCNYWSNLSVFVVLPTRAALEVANVDVTFFFLRAGRYTLHSDLLLLVLGVFFFGCFDFVLSLLQL
jgi:hypothetical protein